MRHPRYVGSFLALVGACLQARADYLDVTARSIVNAEDEVAVMVESKTPFAVKPGMDAMEIKGYALSCSRQ